MSSSSSQEGSRSPRSSRSRLVRRSHSPFSSRRSRSHSRRSSRSHAPSRSSHASGGSFRAPPPSLSRHSLVTSPALPSRRVAPSATVSHAPSSPPPTFVTPVGTSSVHSDAVSRAPPRLLLPLFPPLTLTSRAVSPSLPLVATGPPFAPRPALQSTPWLPAPADGNPDVLSPRPVALVPMSFDRQILDVGRLPATPSARPERQESHADVSVGLGGLPSLGVSAAGESPRTRPLDQDVG